MTPAGALVPRNMLLGEWGAQDRLLIPNERTRRFKGPKISLTAFAKGFDETETGWARGNADPGHP